MKKIFALILALSLLCCAVALAEEQEITSATTYAPVTLTYEIVLSEDFIVTIPSSVALSENGDASFDVKIDMSDYENDANMVVVRLGDISSFTSGETEDAISYTVQMDNADSAVLVTGNTVICGWANELEKAQTLYVKADAEEADAAAPGNYSASLNFWVEVRDKDSEPTL